MIPLSEPPEPAATQNPAPHNPAPISGRQPTHSTAVDISKGYSSVNKLSLLPDDVRTAGNLEGESVPTDQESLLLEKYRKERADYEQKQLQKMAESKAKREGGPPQAPAVLEGGAMYEDVDPSSTGASKAEALQEGPVEINPYQFPIDAVPHVPGKMGVAKRSPKKLSMGTGVLVAGEDYTAVFNTLPKGHVLEKVPPQSRTRALSDSSQPSSSLKAATVAYENSPSPLKDSPEQPGEAGHAASGGFGGEGVSERQDSNRQSKRKVAKEVVEFDPNKQRKFRMTSDIRKKSDRKSAEVDGGSSENSQNDSDSSPQVRPFSIHADEQGQMSYALVNMEDKRRYRLEANATKREGSGTPQHYRVPIASS